MLGSHSDPEPSPEQQNREEAWELKSLQNAEPAQNFQAMPTADTVTPGTKTHRKIVNIRKSK